MSTLTKTEKQALNELFISLHVKKSFYRRFLSLIREIFLKFYA